MNLLDEAFTVWCGLRNILQKDREKYFVSYSSIGFEICERQVNRYETNAIKKGFEEFNKGKTSGSRVKFYRTSDQRIILLHKPHPGDEMSIGAIKDLAIRLEEMGEL